MGSRGRKVYKIQHMTDEELTNHFEQYPDNLKKLVADKKWLERLVWMVARKIPEACVSGSFAAARLLSFFKQIVLATPEIRTFENDSSASCVLRARSLGEAMATDCTLDACMDNILATIASDTLLPAAAGADTQNKTDSL
jgi:hypothetical protein